MDKADIPANTIWYRPGYSNALNKLRDLVRKIRPSSLPRSAQQQEGNPASQQQRELLFQKPMIAWLWITLALLDSIWQYAIRTRWLLYVSGKSTIFDRYVPDGVLDLSLRFPHMDVARWPLTQAMKKLAVRPHKAFLLMLPMEEMQKRMELKQEPFPDSDKIREERYLAYVNMAKNGQWEIVDGDRSREAIHRDIAGRLNILPADQQISE